MFSIDLSESERLKDLLFRASSQADEGIFILKKLQEETTGDLLLKSLAQSETIADDLLTAVNSLTIIKETLYDLGRITFDAIEEYHNGETAKVGRILQKEE